MENQVLQYVVFGFLKQELEFKLPSAANFWWRSEKRTLLKV